ncbi:MAG TPA: cupin domain-containing protein [Panacibacter sp.]|nr:cupin domain-containing protein [Panacibacter sp.]
MQTSFIIKEKESKQAYNLLGHPALLKVSGSNTQGQLSFFSGEYNKNQGPPLHFHDADETFYILEGEFIFHAGDTKVNAIAGDTIFVPRNMPHTYLTVSETGRMLFMINPTGLIEKLFEKFTLYKEMPSLEELIELNESYGLTIVGPPLTPG